MRIGLVAAAVSQNARSLAEAWSACGHEVVVLSLHGGAWGPIPVIEARPSSRSGRLDFWALGAEARHRLSAARVDLVVGYHITSYGVLAARTGLRPLALVAAGGDILKEQYGSLGRRILMPAAARWAIRRADLILSWGGHLSARLRELGAPSERIFTLPRGIDLDLFDAPDRPGERRSPNLVVLSSRSLKPLYRVDLLLRGAALARARGVPVELQIFGEGPQREALVRLARELDLGPAAHFLGARPHAEVARALHEADVLVSLARSDGVPASLIEAMATGVLPVLTDLPAYRDWVEDGVNGLLVRSDDPADLASFLGRAAEDDALRRRAARLNVAIARERGDLRRNGARLAAELERLLRASPAPPGET